MPKKSKKITLRQKETRVGKVQLRDTKIAITAFIDKADALRLAKEIEKRWPEKGSLA